MVKTKLFAATLAAAALAAALVLPAGGTAQGGLQADLSLTNVDSVDPVGTGANLTYAIDVRNAGPATATGLAITDNLSGAATAVSANPQGGTCNPNPHKVVCKLPSLAADATWSVSIVVVVNKKQGSITNAASVQSALPDPRPGDNSQSQTTAIAPPPEPPNPRDCAGINGTIVGSDDADTLTGTEHRDVIVALGGDDVVTGLGGNDLICGGSGDDDLRGQADADILRAKSGDDLVRGGDGSDDVGGGSGRDQLFGGLRPDILRGGPGRDRCRGGFGHDSQQGC